MKPTKLITLTEVVIKRRTAKAVLCGHEDWEEDVWIPLSQIRDETDDVQEGVITSIQIPEWLAADKGIA